MDGYQVSSKLIKCEPYSELIVDRSSSENESKQADFKGKVTTDCSIFLCVIKMVQFYTPIFNSSSDFKRVDVNSSFGLMCLSSIGFTINFSSFGKDSTATSSYPFWILAATMQLRKNELKITLFSITEKQ